MKTENQKVSREQAEKEIKKWLDFKNVGSRKREENEASIEELIESVVEGVISLDADTNAITHKLRVPIMGPEKNVIADKLIYKPRLTVHETQTQLKGIKSNDTDGRVMAYISALSEQSRNVIRYMDTVDYSISQQIVVFYL